MKAVKAVFTILSPKLPENLEVMREWTGSFKDEEEVYESQIADCVIEEQQADRLRFRGVHFKNVIFREIEFSRADLEDVRFENCDLSNVNLEGSLFHRVEFINCKLVGANFSESSFKNVVIEQSNARYANCSYTHWKRAKMEKTIFSTTDFRGSKFVDMHLLETEFRESMLAGTKLKGIDLSDCDIQGVGVQVEDLTGVIVSPLQAVELSKLFGLVIKE